MSRKELKAKAKQSVKKHYLLFICICAIASFIGSEFTSSLTITKDLELSNIVEKENKIANTIEKNNIETAKIEAKKKEKKLQENNKSEILGNTRGVFSLIRNSIDSGSIFISFIEMLSSVIHSPSIATIIFIILSFIVMFGIWYFIINTYKVIARRMFLEAGIYEKVPIQRFLYLIRINKLHKAAFTMFVEAIYQGLWNLTIIGGMIKKYSYFLVPYIIAENPNMKANDAITLSRQMMNGHKWECFIFELSFIWWGLLGICTLGLSDVLFLNPYKIATFTEYYKKLREEAKEKNIENIEELNDIYLYEKASKKLIDERYDDINKIMNKKIPKIPKKKGIIGFINEYLGITTSSNADEKKYEEEQNREVKINQYKDAINGNLYPTRLNPVPEKEKRKKIETLNYLRRYRITSIILLFFIFSFVGWIWEVSLHLISDGVFVNRGVMHGPWLPIYGWGGILILVVLNKFRKKPAIEFITTLFLCGFVEYFTSYYLEITHHGQKWWDYSGYFININGRICAEGLLVFGLGGLAIVYLLAPTIDNYLKKINTKIVVPLCIVLLSIFVVDQVYSKNHPNEGKGITDYKTSMVVEYNKIERQL